MPQAFILCRMERTRSCPEVGVKRFAFATEPEAWDSSWRHIQNTEVSSQKEGWKDRNRGVGYQHPGPEVDGGDGGLQLCPDGLWERGAQRL